MSATGSIFNGQKTYTIDSKNRVSIQPGWRPDGGTEVFLIHSKTRDVPMIKVVTPERFRAQVQKISDSTRMSEKDKSNKIRSLSIRCFEASINEQGKLLIPKELCDRLQLQPEAEVLQLGCGTYFEIWNKALFNEDEQLDLDDNENDDDIGGF